MIVYQSTKSGFVKDAINRDIENVIASAYLHRTGRYAPHAEMQAWKYSLLEMSRVLQDDEIDDDIGVGVEFGIPQSSKRIDFLISGRDANDESKVIIVELKQWSEAKASGKDGIVIARRGGSSAEREGPHPSYQAWSYASLLHGFNEAVYEGGLKLQPCAYLHNYVADGVIDGPEYLQYTQLAPLFLRGELERARLRDFIKRHVKHGDRADLIYRIENGRIRPSKMLVDSLAGMLKGNREFVLIDDQKVVFENALVAARRAQSGRKQVVIIKGGPGTGKSVVAVNLLVQLSKLGLNAKYVSKNAAPRAVFQAKLSGQMRPIEIANLFTGSGAFTDTPSDTFDALIVDEAHRLNEKSGLYSNLGENQIKEIMHSAKCAIFFVDDDQIVTFKDTGSASEIERWASHLGADVSHFELASQFRCNGSDGYVAWLDQVLGIRETANNDFDTSSFDFRVVESPSQLHELITERNSISNKARVVAGYCWDWVSRRSPDRYDIEIQAHGYRRRWNLDRDGSLWLIAPKSVDEVGCIHTCQGLELDYVGVIIGADLVVRNGLVTTDPTKRAKTDKSLSGFKKLLRSAPSETADRADRIIRNTYRTLMTRGMKGCYVYCVDPALGDYFGSKLHAGNP